jgi:SSS family solute:Na+ symporter
MIMNQMSVLSVLILFTLVFVAAISSAASLLHSASVIIVNDLVRPFVPDKREDELVKYARLFVILVGIFSVAAALWANSLIGLFSLAYTMAGGGVIPVLLVGLLWKRRRNDPFAMGTQNSRLSPWGARIGLVSGAVCSLAFGILWGVAISAALAIILSLLIPAAQDKDYAPSQKGA